MPTTYNKIATVTVGAGGASSIDFQNIPSTYTDLCLSLSSRINRAGNNFLYNILRFNNDTGNNYSMRDLYGFELGGGYGPTGSASRQNTIGYFAVSTTSDNTANTFANTMLYIPNYTGSNNKSWSCDYVTENNSTTYYWLGLSGGLWSNTSAINRLTIVNDGGWNFNQYSTATLYGIKNS